MTTPFQSSDVRYFEPLSPAIRTLAGIVELAECCGPLGDW